MVTLSRALWKAYCYIIVPLSTVTGIRVIIASALRLPREITLLPGRAFQESLVQEVAELLGRALAGYRAGNTTSSGCHIHGALPPSCLVRHNASF